MSKPASTLHILIPAAGSGSRAGSDIPKQYQKLAGKMILRHTLEKVLSLPGLASVRVIIDPAHVFWYEEAVHGLDIAPPVMGAATRQQSVHNGLQSLSCGPDDIVLIHDAARPFVHKENITSLLAATGTAGAATLAVSIADTIVNGDYQPFDRNAMHAVQTPQAFRANVILAAHEKFKDDLSFTDDAGLAAAYGAKITLVPGSRDNFKITTAEDLQMAEKLLGSKTETRTGFGYDVHAFDPAPAEYIRLGGVDIAHDRKLLGHSDADVILHALTDALLGTIGGGDIGQLFPPSDPQWKGADSGLFLTEALSRVEAAGGKLLHADITLIAETPKIGPHREKMLTRLSSLLGLDQTRIGLKATTSEGLGFTGRKEGIVAQAVATVAFYDQAGE